MNKLMTAVVAAVLTVSAPALAQKTYNLSLAGASPGGFWSLIHAGVNKAFVAANPGSIITYRTTGGGFANIPMVSRHKADIGLAHDAELKSALDGAAPFKKPITNLRAIAVVYNNVAMQITMTKSFADKYGIKKFADIAAKKPPVRVVFNRRGNAVHNLCVAMFREIGVSIADIKAWGGQIEYAGSRQAFQLMKDRRIDMVAGGDGTAPGRRTLEVASKIDIVLLQPTVELTRNVARKTGTRPGIIKGGTYKFQPEDVPSVLLSAAIMVNKDASDKVAYDLAKAMIEQIGQFKSVHRAFKRFDAKTVTSKFLVPFHPGAERYFKEAGLR